MAELEVYSDKNLDSHDLLRLVQRMKDGKCTRAEAAEGLGKILTARLPHI